METQFGPTEYERRSVQHCMDFLAPLCVTCPQARLPSCGCFRDFPKNRHAARMARGSYFLRLMRCRRRVQG